MESTPACVNAAITCSRDAVKPAEFYYFTQPSALATLATDAEAMLQNTTYFQQQMQNCFACLQPTRANPLSNTVYFKKISDKIVDKYSLATMHLTIAGRTEEHAHVVVMPHVGRAVLDEFMDDLETGIS